MTTTPEKLMSKGATGRTDLEWMIYDLRSIADYNTHDRREVILKAADQLEAQGKELDRVREALRELAIKFSREQLRGGLEGHVEWEWCDYCGVGWEPGGEKHRPMPDGSRCPCEKEGT